MSGRVIKSHVGHRTNLFFDMASWVIWGLAPLHSTHYAMSAPPTALGTQRCPHAERTTGIAQTCCQCEDMNVQKVSDLSRDRQLLSGSAGTGTQTCLPSQHRMSLLLPPADIWHGEEEGLLMGKRKMSSIPCITVEHDPRNTKSQVDFIDLGLKIFQNVCFVLLFLIAK